MNIEETMKKVDLLLQDRGLDGEYQEQAVRQLLYHLFTAIDIYRYMTMAEKTKAGYWYRTFKGTFSLRNFLKERKRNRERKNPPCTPLIKKDSVEKGQKNTHTVVGAKPVLDDDQKVFWNECSMYIGNPYDEQMVRNFFHYWAEKDEKSGKMLWQTKRTWNTKFRLISWSNNGNTKRDEAASIDLKKKQQREAQQKSKSVGIFRTHEPSKQEVAIARAEKSKDDYEEYLKTHPNSQLEKYRASFNDSGGLTP